MGQFSVGVNTYRQYLDEGALSPVIQGLRKKITFAANPEMHAAYYADYRYGARVQVRTDDGAEYVEERRQLLGAGDRPFDHAEKFREGASLFLSPPRVEQALVTLRGLETITDIRTVMHQFVPDPEERIRA